ncbi:hypothetical protein [Bdellovibrio svalbardensis]|uniref:FecR protein domain-containing protein n=1 Tax=Bdellovibrio svalbardensis TaxID=2972972 RepID=A0ABT6DI47_9BACT|nr:hypothetical protein [Bdellovibrio svalbardensis]MDG0816532.1 hypothetical protein [Bdellovibrio svalbardensis]
MKKWLKFLTFLLAFQMEVRVRASGDVLQQPSACMKSKETCAIHVTGPAFHMMKDDFGIHARENSTLMRLSAGQWRLLKGILWVEKSTGVEFETPYANVKASQGQYWLIEKGSQVVIRNIDADLQVVLRDGKKLEVPAGFEFWVSGINSKGQSEYGMIRPIDMKEHLPLWNALYSGSKDNFVKEVQKLKENWGDLTEKSAFIYQAATERKLASVAESKRQEEEKSRQQAAERQKLKSIYFQRTFER